MFLLLALRFFDLRRARGAGCLADEFTAGGDTREDKISTVYSSDKIYSELTFHRHYPWWLEGQKSCAGKCRLPPR